MTQPNLWDDVQATRAPLPAKAPLQRAMPPAQPPGLRAVGDVKATRQAIYGNVLNAVRSWPEVSNQRYALSVGEVDYEDPEDYSLADAKQAILNRRTLGRRIRGTFQLKDITTGDVVDQRRLTIGTLPILADSGAYVIDGGKWGLRHQARLRPGVFARQKASGELSAHVNVAGGAGHQYELEPDTGVFRVVMGQARLPAMPLLNALGVSHQAMRDAWGEEVYQANARASDPKALTKLYNKIRGGRADQTEDKAEAIRDAFARMQLDPEVTARTLGTPYERMTPEAVLASMTKLLKIERGEDEEDDRDAMPYQRVLGPEDIFAERAKNAGRAMQQMLWKATYPGNLQRVQPGMASKALLGAIMNSGLGEILQEIGPAELLDNTFRISRMGDGGIPSSDSIPESARDVMPSYLGYIDPGLSPESGRIGVDNRLAINTRKDEQGRLYSQFLNNKTGEIEWKNPQDLADATVAFPGELDSGKPYVAGIRKGHSVYVPREQADYQLAHAADTFSPLSNLIPMKAAGDAKRISMGGRMIAQALPLVNREAPLVQAGVPGTDKSFSQEYGDRMAARRAPVAGVVTAIEQGSVQIRGDDGKVSTVELYDHHPNNMKTYRHNTPVVQIGQTVNEGDLVASSNFTDDQGAAAFGLNARVAYIPWKGLPYEDASAVSESFAKRMSSQHMYEEDVDIDDNTTVSKKDFVSSFPAIYDRDVLAKFDDNGLLKPGTKVEYGDPVILAVRERPAVTRLGRRRRNFANAAVTWDHHDPGVVTDAVMGKKGAQIYVKSESPLQQGDKLSGLFGDKGIIGSIIPDVQMPRDSQGQPIEVLLNSESVISRGNPAQIHEASLGKIAAITGKPYILPDFETTDDLVEFVDRELRDHGISRDETIIDPTEGDREIPNILVGNRFLLRLHHSAEGKAQARSAGADSYTAEGEPAKGGKTGAKRVGMLELGAMLSHGAYGAIRDASIVRGQSSPEYWRRVMSGYNPPPPEIPFTYKKFVASLQGAGINPVRSGTRTQFLAMRDADIDELAGDRELKSADTVNWRDPALKPVKGGLFDPALTGGLDGNRWSFISTHQPMPQPIMEEPIRRVLGLTEAKFRDVIGGKEQLNGQSGPKAIYDALDKIDLDTAIKHDEVLMKGSRKTQKDAAIRRLRYLQAAKKNDIHPRDWMVTKVPVLPPTFRPVTTMQGGTQLIADPNMLYQELFDARDSLKDLSERTDDTGEAQLTLYDAMKGVVGLGEPIQPENREKRVKGILKAMLGDSPKYGTVQRKLLSSQVDLVGRGVVSPNPDLDMDHVRIPEDKAWSLYEPFITRRLVRRGMSRMNAMKAVKDKNAQAKVEMLAEMKERPVMINRAPSLHKFSIMAFWPELTKAHTIEIPPTVVGGFSMDFDGDQANFHLPSTDEAVKDAIEKMMPSRNLFSAADFKSPMFEPRQEYVAGLWEASTRKGSSPPIVFKTKADALAAYRRGEIGLDANVRIMEA